MDIFDTHAHLLDDHFNEDREALIAALPGQGIQLVMEACTDLQYLEKLIPFVEQHPMIYGAAGLHPEELNGLTLSDLDRVGLALAHPKIRAVGEIGLDYYWPENRPRRSKRPSSTPSSPWRQSIICPSSSTIGRPTGTRWTSCDPTKGR